MTSDMESLQNALYLDTVPESWARRAYPTTAGLAAWFMDLLNRIKELEAWTGDFAMPSTVWLTGFFNPQSFLTAIMQSTARRNEWPLDQMALQCDVTKKNREEFRSPPREGAYVHGLFMEGARWDTQNEKEDAELLSQRSALLANLCVRERVSTRHNDFSLPRRRKMLLDLSTQHSLHMRPAVTQLWKGGERVTVEDGS